MKTSKLIVKGCLFAVAIFCSKIKCFTPSIWRYSDVKKTSIALEVNMYSGWPSVAKAREYRKHLLRPRPIVSSPFSWKQPPMEKKNSHPKELNWKFLTITNHERQTHIGLLQWCVEPHGFYRNATHKIGAGHTTDTPTQGLDGHGAEKSPLFFFFCFGWLLSSQTAKKNRKYSFQ